jgi:threonine aldolase
MTINLISDTVTLPTAAMKQAMWAAPVGDDVFREDPTVRALEEQCADIFGHEAGLYCPSGTMTNQIAIKVHTRPLDEVICDEMSHIFQYEVGGYAFHSGVGISLLRTPNGILQPGQVAAAIKAPFDWLPRSSLVVIENTCNKGGGSIYPAEAVKGIRDVCRANGMALHADGARIFNALVASDYSARDFGAWVDSLSICLSKGLGAPVGSVLTGTNAFIKEARRVRKAMGGGMRQAGYMAAAGIHALDHHIEQLREDHAHAAHLAGVLREMPYVADILPVETNILIFDLQPAWTTERFLAALAAEGIRATAFGPQAIRFVLHLDVSKDMVEHVAAVLRRMG